MLPTFICPGAQKSATTTLYKILKQHPDVFLPDRKELKFFSGENWNKGLGWYQRQFEAYSEQKAVGDITPHYMWTKRAVKRIYDTLGPSVKFIFMLRNPAERTFSQYRMDLKSGIVKRSFEECVEKEISALTNDKNPVTQYVSNGLYGQQIEWFLEYYTKENMYFVLFEDFVRDIEKECAGIFSFLEIEKKPDIDYNIQSLADFEPRNLKLYVLTKKIAYGIRKRILTHVKSKKIVRKANRLVGKIIIGKGADPLPPPKISDQEKAALLAFYESDIETLERIISRKGLWK